jgi:hypothetical protein
MIQKFIDKFMSSKDAIRAKYAEKHPDNYAELFRVVIEALNPDDSYGEPDPKRITKIDHGEYQGTLLFVVAENAYKPHAYWAAKVGYGSCSGCDTLQRIQADCEEYGKPPTEKQLDAYMTLALHVVQNLVEIGGE